MEGGQTMYSCEEKEEFIYKFPRSTFDVYKQELLFPRENAFIGYCLLNLIY